MTENRVRAINRSAEQMFLTAEATISLNSKVKTRNIEKYADSATGRPGDQSGISNKIIMVMIWTKVF